MRDYKAEDDREKERKGKFQTKLELEYLSKFDGIVKASFLRWCVDNDIIDAFKKQQ